MWYHKVFNVTTDTVSDGPIVLFQSRRLLWLLLLDFSHTVVISVLTIEKTRTRNGADLFPTAGRSAGRAPGPLVDPPSPDTRDGAARAKIAAP